MHPRARRKLNDMKRERRARKKAKKELLASMQAGIHVDVPGVISHAFPYLRATLDVVALRFQRWYHAIFGM